MEHLNAYVLESFTPSHTFAMNNASTHIPPEQVMIAAPNAPPVMAGDISRALFYANARLSAILLYLQQSFATGDPGYAAAFYTLMRWEMEVFIYRSYSYVLPLMGISPSPTIDLYDPFHQHMLSRPVIGRHS
jgi:hypothetical protein